MLTSLRVNDVTIAGTGLSYLWCPSDAVVSTPSPLGSIYFTGTYPAPTGTAFQQYRNSYSGCTGLYYQDWRSGAAFGLKDPCYAAWVATAPTPATAAGQTAPTARNFEATATPQDSPSVDLATMENVMASPYRRAESPVCPQVGLKSEDGRVLQRLGFADVGPHRRFVSALAEDFLEEDSRTAREQRSAW